MLQQTIIVFFLVATILPGCAPKKQAKLEEPVVDTVAKRQMQSRVFDTSEEKTVLSASAAVLQDLGFNLDESCPQLGLITSSKNRTAENSEQVANHVGKMLLFAAASLVLTQGHGVVLTTNPPGSVPFDKEQKIRASLVSTPVGDKEEHIMVRLTMQRVVWNENNQISLAEVITDPQIYQQFFDKLAQSIFLEAHGV